MSAAIEYRPMKADEAPAVSAMMIAAFDEFIAPDYGPDGIAEFHDFAAPEAIVGRMAEDHFVRVAIAGSAPVGMIEIRDNNHVALLFVDKAYQHHGVATSLLELALADARAANPDLARVTVNSSRFGVPAYEKLGFRQTGAERTVNGIVFIPMAKQLND